MERKINWQRLILAFLVATFLFCFGIFLGFLAKGYISQSSIQLEESVRNDIINLETIYLLEDTFPCNQQVLSITSEKLDYLGELITVLEVKKGKFDTDVLELKKLYTVLEIRHFLLTDARNAKCSQNYDTILFFYSNQDNCKSEVEKTAFVLTYLRNKYDTVKVYSFDIELNSDVITALKSQYQINGCTGVVLNKEKVPSVISDASQIETLLEKK